MEQSCGSLVERIKIHREEERSRRDTAAAAASDVHQSFYIPPRAQPMAIQAPAPHQPSPHVIHPTYHTTQDAQAFSAAQAAFDEVDVNGDGVISRSEWTSFTTQNASAQSMAATTLPQVVSPSTPHAILRDVVLQRISPQETALTPEQILHSMTDAEKNFLAHAPPAGGLPRPTYLPNPYRF